MKRIFVLLWVGLACIIACGQSASGRYASRMTMDGMLYFIMPQKLTETQGVKKFEYDVTCLSWSDTLTVNFTFRSKSMSNLTGLVLTSGSQNIECLNYKPLFVDIVKSGYEIRITALFSVEDFTGLLDSQHPLGFCFYQDGIREEACYSKKAWRADRVKLLDIFRLFRQSKQNGL